VLIAIDRRPQKKKAPKKNPHFPPGAQSLRTRRFEWRENVNLADAANSLLHQRDQPAQNNNEDVRTYEVDLRIRQDHVAPAAYGCDAGSTRNARTHANSPTPGSRTNPSPLGPATPTHIFHRRGSATSQAIPRPAVPLIVIGSTDALETVEQWNKDFTGEIASTVFGTVRSAAAARHRSPKVMWQTRPLPLWQSSKAGRNLRKLFQTRIAPCALPSFNSDAPRPSLRFISPKARMLPERRPSPRSKNSSAA